MNLVIALLSTRQFLTAEKIRQSVAGYDESASDEAFSRMFERDKNELRDLGVPLQTGPSSGYSSVEGYRIDRSAYELPDIGLTSEESAAVAVAVRMWDSPELISAAQSALLKLRAAGVQVESSSGLGTVTAVPTRTRGSEPALGALLAAVEAGQTVRFRHRSTLTDPFSTRTVQPWGVVTTRGRWYLVGHDVDRDATRTFRLSRIGEDITVLGPRGAVRKPEGVDLRAVVERATSTPLVDGVGRVWVARDRAHELRRLGAVVADLALAGRPGSVLEIPAETWGWLARLVAGHGADAAALEPRELRDEVLTRLRGALATEQGEGR
nr:YafY family protein [Rhodococcus sp. HNM0569]